MKGKNKFKRTAKPKYIINEKHAGNTYTYIIHNTLDTYTTYSYVPHSGSRLEMNRKKKIYIYINKHMLIYIHTYIHTLHIMRILTHTHIHYIPDDVINKYFNPDKNKWLISRYENDFRSLRVE